MIETGSWLARLALLAVLGLLALALPPSPAQAAKYSVVQCGWGVGKDADWDENAAQRYNHSALCVPSGSDVWSGVEIRTYTRPGAGSAASSTLGRWRWKAPANTGITNVRGTWWHELHNHFQHRLGGMVGGDFKRTHSSSTSRGMEAFAAGFSPAASTFESRLVCARPEPKRCDTSPSSAAMVRALTITLEDKLAPTLTDNGSVLGGGWLKGTVEAGYTASDKGGGLYWGEILVDGNRVGYGEHSCRLVRVGADLHGREMRPCDLQGSASHSIKTGTLSDGSHTVQACVTDIAENRSCAPQRSFRVDNNPPAAPSRLEVVGGDGWRRSNRFALSWTNPGQGAASPIAAASYRVSGPNGYDSGELKVEGQGVAGLQGPELTEPGEYRVAVWLKDLAGNSSADSFATATVRFDDRPPEVAFRGFGDVETPERIRARVRDLHAGPAGGTISYRPLGKGSWVELPTKLVAGEDEATADLVATFPSEQLEPGRYEFLAEATDAAGNRAESRNRLDGSPMVLSGRLKTPTRLFAQLEVNGRNGSFLAAPFWADPVVSGRLSDVAGAPLPGRELRVTVSPVEGGSTQTARHSVVTDAGGNFSLPLGRSTSRLVEVRFPGDARLESSRAPDLSLRVTGALSFRPVRTRVETGRVLRMRGQVNIRDAFLPAGGKLVAIQYFERRARTWRPVVFTRSDGRGRFRARYRFRYLTRPATIRMRAVSLAEAGWPYAAAASRPVKVRVLPRRWARVARRR